jgi:hypothetical protein
MVHHTGRGDEPRIAAFLEGRGLGHGAPPRGRWDGPCALHRHGRRLDDHARRHHLARGHGRDLHLHGPGRARETHLLLRDSQRERDRSLRRWQSIPAPHSHVRLLHREREAEGDIRHAGPIDIMDRGLTARHRFQSRGRKSAHGLDRLGELQLQRREPGRADCGTDPRDRESEPRVVDRPDDQRGRREGEHHRE